MWRHIKHLHHRLEGFPVAMRSMREWTRSQYTPQKLWWVLATVLADRGQRVLLDCEWMLVDSTNQPLTLKRHPKMSHIRIVGIKLAEEYLEVQADTQVPLQIRIGARSSSQPIGQINSCCPRSTTSPYDNQAPQKIHSYCSAFLNTDCRFVRVSHSSRTGTFANQSHFLISSTPSFTDHLSRIAPHVDATIASDCLPYAPTLTSHPAHRISKTPLSTKRFSLRLGLRAMTRSCAPGVTSSMSIRSMVHLGGSRIAPCQNTGTCQGKECVSVCWPDFWLVSEGDGEHW
ncbi:hypothetical protein DFJ77DRAFT_188272 [Powellomyces hirtus]|nr:hypothetical protein DFJ77DRAFT_188272 [Powellomyces hirtus]